VSAAEPRLVEIVHFFLYDVGRSADLKKLAALVPAHPDIMGIVKRRDTPASLTLPKPLVLRLDDGECSDLGGYECFSSQAKIYEEGALSVVVRVRTRVPFDQLHALRGRKIVASGEELAIEGYAEKVYRRIFAAIRPAISDPYPEDAFDREYYTAFCLLDCPEDPATFLAQNRDYAAALLIGEDPDAGLHESQVAATLERPFSYYDRDLAIFEMDRCLIIDRDADYEDLLLIVEHANYHLLELRVLDKLLDRWLDEAEDDIRTMITRSGRWGRKGGSARMKFAHIQALRFDALFILENLENSSKIIGDYYLGQVYGRLCSIFNTEGWKWSVERRLDALQDVYEMVKTDSGERRVIALEIVFILVCIIFPIIQILQVMLTA
jgi:hypothetical protein